MAAANVISATPSSFVYEDLVSQVQAIQTKMNKFGNILDDRWKNNKKMRNEMNSHPFTFIDPYGNQMIDEHMDHESTNSVVRKFKKDYVPKYLQQWIKIGILDKTGISPITDYDLKTTVSNYVNKGQFIAYGEVIVWIGRYESLTPQRLILRVLLTDDLERIKLRIKEQQHFTNLELKLSTTDKTTGPTEKDWNEGTLLKSEDTIMSCQLYKNDCSIMAKLIREMVNDCL
jgi:hypothetical protein